MHGHEGMGSSMGRTYKVAVLKGDGIGPEVVASAKRVLEATASRNKLKLDLPELPIGMQAYRQFGRTLPPETLSKLEDCDGWILGPLQTGTYPKDDEDYPMASGKIRRDFDLFANIRPIRSLVPTLRKNIDLVIVRENTEGLYPERSLQERYRSLMPDQNTRLSVRVITRGACRRIAETAFRLARSRERKRRVTSVHKANVLIESDGLFLEETRKVSEDFPDIKLEERLLDSTAMRLVTNPESFDVVLTLNLYGDVLSDEAAGLVGGLGLAPSLNSGERYAMAQAVHGSAPDIAGKGVANPVAIILSATMLLEWLHSRSSDQALMATARKIERAVEEQLASRERKDLTIDLGGSASTNEFTSALIGRICSDDSNAL
jgi:3-isopropylmalate dehydrogenase